MCVAETWIIPTREQCVLLAWTLHSKKTIFLVLSLFLFYKLALYYVISKDGRQLMDFFRNTNTPQIERDGANGNHNNPAGFASTSSDIESAVAGPVFVYIRGRVERRQLRGTSIGKGRKDKGPKTCKSILICWFFAHAWKLTRSQMPTKSFLWDCEYVNFIYLVIIVAFSTPICYASDWCCQILIKQCK